jgi:hypothetical protein
MNWLGLKCNVFATISYFVQPSATSCQSYKKFLRCFRCSYRSWSCSDWSNEGLVRSGFVKFKLD